MSKKIHRVAVTLELTDEQMIGIGFAETGLMVIAKHAEVRSYAKQLSMKGINDVTGITNELRRAASQRIKNKLADDE